MREIAPSRGGSKIVEVLARVKKAIGMIDPHAVGEALVKPAHDLRV